MNMSLIYANSLASAIRERVGLQSALLMAATHYSWQTGKLDGFEKCFFFHKSELLQLVNTGLSQDAIRIPIEILRLIVILSISEVGRLNESMKGF